MSQCESLCCLHMCLAGMKKWCITSIWILWLSAQGRSSTGHSVFLTRLSWPLRVRVYPGHLGSKVQIQLSAQARPSNWTLQISAREQLSCTRRTRYWTCWLSAPDSSNPKAEILRQQDTPAVRTRHQTLWLSAQGCSSNWTLWLSAPDTPSHETRIIRQLDTPVIRTSSA